MLLLLLMMRMMMMSVGRRYCQTRLVESCPSSVNSGDCYVLVTFDCVFLWIGEFSNVIERAKVINFLCI